MDLCVQVVIVLIKQVLDIEKLFVMLVKKDKLNL